jgi:predicted nucleotidyltransferase
MEALDDSIRKPLSSVRGTSGVVVFGSRACGRARPDGDLDIETRRPRDGNT